MMTTFSVDMTRAGELTRRWIVVDGALMYEWDCACGRENRDDFGEIVPHPIPDKTLPCSGCEKRILILRPVPDEIKRRVTDQLH